MSREVPQVGHFDVNRTRVGENVDEAILWPKTCKLLFNFKYMGHSNAGELRPQSFITFSSRQYAKALIQSSRKNSFSKNDTLCFLSF